MTINEARSVLLRHADALARRGYDDAPLVHEAIDALSVGLLHTEPKTLERLQAAVDLGELILCMAESNESATPFELAALSNALPNTSLPELVSLVIAGMRDELVESEVFDASSVEADPNAAQRRGL